MLSNATSTQHASFMFEELNGRSSGLPAGSAGAGAYPLSSLSTPASEIRYSTVGERLNVCSGYFCGIA